MGGFYTSNPYWGQGMDNLAGALFPDPLTEVRAGLLGDQRRMTQADRRKLEAEAVSTEIQNRETEQALADLLGALQQTPGLGANTPLAGVLGRYGVGQGDKSNDIASTIQALITGNLAQGTEDERFQSMAMQGKAVPYRGALTPETAATVHKRDIQGQNQRANYRSDRTLEGTVYRADKGLEGSIYRADKGLEGTRYRADKQAEASKYGAEQRAGATVESSRVRASAPRAGGRPITVTPKTVDQIREDVTRTVYDQVGEDAGDADLDSGLVEELVASVTGHYQQTGNYALARRRGWEDVLGESPPEVIEDAGAPMWPFDNSTTITAPSGAPSKAPAPANSAPTAGPPAGMMPQIDPRQAIAEARQAIARGLPRAEAEARLRKAGIDPAGL